MTDYILDFIVIAYMVTNTAALLDVMLTMRSIKNADKHK